MVLEKTLKSPLDFKEVKPVHPKGNQSWIFIGRTDAEAEAPILWPPDAKNWLLEKTLMLGKIEGSEGDDRGWDGWMVSPTRWTWVWVNSGSCVWPGKPGMLQPMGSQRVGHDWAAEQQLYIYTIQWIPVPSSETLVCRIHSWTQTMDLKARACPQWSCLLHGSCPCLF